MFSSKCPKQRIKRLLFHRELKIKADECVFKIGSCISLIKKGDSVRGENAENVFIECYFNLVRTTFLLRHYGFKSNRKFLSMENMRAKKRVEIVILLTKPIIFLMQVSIFFVYFRKGRLSD